MVEPIKLHFPFFFFSLLKGTDLSSMMPKNKMVSFLVRELRDLRIICRVRNFLIGGCVTVPTQPSKLGSLKKTVGDFRLPLRFTDFGTQGGAKMGGVLVEMG